MHEIQIAVETEPLTYFQAEIHCLTLVHNGHKDWRLPTYSEFREHDSTVAGSWFQNETHQIRSMWPVTPVRDSKPRGKIDE